ncbi:lantibiotic dehydratase C-terminal domain-containing protein [Catenulispora pinisilvae]|uniref:lantibiotic dehydratase C-terminal domain-containing protein n=1 Tax=Catenulispora pinisilvae TaxID=2705253 RepID=UPI0018919DF9|nr:lantibiotic dehydratase C-terminal domain-containing protein [Catenulispora pinisilvae]
MDEVDQWVGVHVYTMTPLDTIIRELLPDLLSDLRGQGLIGCWFFLRHWADGPHLRVRLRLAGAEHGEQVRALVSAHVTALYSRIPPSRPMAEQDYVELARRLTVWEPDVEVGGLAPNDSHAFVPYRPEHGKYGYGFALRAVEEHFGVCSELALAAVCEGWGEQQRGAHCFALLAGGIATPPAGPAVSSAIQELYRRQRAALLPVARAARTAPDVPPGPDRDPAGRWLDSVRTAGVHAADPSTLAAGLGHLACNRLGLRLGQEAVLRGLANLAVRDLAARDVAAHSSLAQDSAARDLAAHGSLAQDPAAKNLADVAASGSTSSPAASSPTSSTDRVEPERGLS